MMDNIIKWWNKSSEMDRTYGSNAYDIYRSDILILGGYTTNRLDDITLCAVFALCSPNSDYEGNLRSTRIIIEGFEKGVLADDLQGLSTYKACAGRAYRVLAGEPPEVVFSVNANKTHNFFRNLVNPYDRRFVTIDGHMYNLWKGQRATLKSAAAKFKPREYWVIAEDFKEVAKAVGLVPCQLQATLWWTYKRVLGIRFDPQIKFDWDQQYED